MKKCRFIYIGKTANSSKLVALEALHAEYLRYLQVCIDALISNQKCSIPLKNFKSFFPVEKALNTNFVSSCRQHALAIVAAWFASLYVRKIKTEIGRLPNSSKALYSIGKLGISQPTESISQSDIDFYWSLLRAASKPPTVSSRAGIWVSYLTATLSVSEKTKLTQWWLTVSSLTKYSRIRLPLVPNPHVSSPNQLSKGGLLRKDRRGRWRIEFVEKKEIEPIESLELKDAQRVSVDVGLNVLAAVTGGRLYGQSLKPKFDRLYRKVKALRANRQRQKLPKNSRRLERMEERLTGFVKSTVGEIANKLVKSFPRHAFVIEDLRNLNRTKGQKRFAYRALQKSLEGKAPTIFVNPAYTSQQCPSCDFVTRANRCSTRFCCRSCGRLSHADAIGGINLLGRSEDKQIDLVDDPRTVKRYLRERYRTRRNSSSRSEIAPAWSGQELTTESLDFSSVGTASNVPEFTCGL